MIKRKEYNTDTSHNPSERPPNFRLQARAENTPTILLQISKGPFRTWQALQSGEAPNNLRQTWVEL